MRDQGHVFHVEMFVVPRSGQDPTVKQLHHLGKRLHEVDWKVHDVVVVPVSEIPTYLTPATD